jgi:hypothetical protein
VRVEQRQRAVLGHQPVVEGLEQRLDVEHEAARL